MTNTILVSNLLFTMHYLRNDLFIETKDLQRKRYVIPLMRKIEDYVTSVNSSFQTKTNAYCKTKELKWNLDPFQQAA